MIFTKGKIAIPVLTIIMLGIASLSVPSISAQEAGNYPSIVQRLAEKFGVEESEVAEVFEMEHKERYANMQAVFTERLDEMVVNGKITDDQKELILEKQEELRIQREMDREMVANMTADERREFYEGQKKELSEWSKENGIDLQILGAFHRHGIHKGFVVGHHLNSI